MKNGFMDHDLKAFFPLFDARFLLRVVSNKEDPCLSCLLVVILFETVGPDVPVEDIDIVFGLIDLSFKAFLIASEQQIRLQ